MTEFQIWVAEKAQYDMNGHELEIARDGFNGGVASLKQRLLKAMEGTLVRDPSMQTIITLIEEM